MITALSVLMNGATAMQSGWKMILTAISLLWLKLRIFPVKSSRVASTRPICQNQWLPCLLTTGELSARSGEALYKAFSGKEALLLQRTQQLHEQKKAGVIFESEEVIGLLTDVLKEPSGKKLTLIPVINLYRATALYKGDKVILISINLVYLPNVSRR